MTATTSPSHRSTDVLHALGRTVAWSAAAVCAVVLLAALAYILWVFGLVVIKALGDIPFGHAMG